MVKKIPTREILEESELVSAHQDLFEGASVGRVASVRSSSPICNSDYSLRASKDPLCGFSEELYL